SRLQTTPFISGHVGEWLRRSGHIVEASPTAMSRYPPRRAYKRSSDTSATWVMPPLEGSSIRARAVLEPAQVLVWARTPQRPLATPCTRADPQADTAAPRKLLRGLRTAPHVLCLSSGSTSSRGPDRFCRRAASASSFARAAPRPVLPGSACHTVPSRSSRIRVP